MGTTDDTAGHTPPGQVVGGDGVEDVDHGPGVGGAARHLLRGLQPLHGEHKQWDMSGEDGNIHGVTIATML